MTVACPQCGHPASGISEVAIEYATPPPQLAGFWVRAAAFVIDAFVIAVTNAFLAAALRLPGVIIRGPESGLVVGTPESIGFDVGALAFRQAVGLGVFLAYTALMLGLNDGRTLGAIAVGIRVARPDGSRISMGRAAGRQAFSLVSRIPLYLGYLWVAWDPERRAWHDMVAGTRVHRTR